jgi:NhaP-type Na+/H+ or K+/H+ antiporter
MPFHLFSSIALTLTVWRLVVLAILILLLRRLPIVMALYRWIPDIKTFREAIFSGTRFSLLCTLRRLELHHAQAISDP